MINVNKYTLTQKEIKYLLSDIDRIVEIFRDTHDEVLDYINKNNRIGYISFVL